MTDEGNCTDHRISCNTTSEQVIKICQDAVIFSLCIRGLNLINLLIRADKIAILSSKGMPYLQLHEKFPSLLNLIFYFLLEAL